MMKIIPPLLGKYHQDDDRKTIGCQCAYAGYSTNQGLVHFNVDDDAPLPKVMTEEQLDTHVVGVIFAQHFSLKKDLELFGDEVND